MKKQLIDYIRDFDECNYTDIIDYFMEINQCDAELKAKYLQDLVWYIANVEVQENATGGI